MKLIRSIAMETDHDYYGYSTEVTRVDLFLAEEMITPEVVAIAKQLQVERLHHAAKSMPHRYWLYPEKRPYVEHVKKGAKSETG